MNSIFIARFVNMYKTIRNYIIIHYTNLCFIVCTKNSISKSCANKSNKIDKNWYILDFVGN